MAELGTDLILVCSAVSPHAVDDDGLLAEQLHRLAVLAAERGKRVAYEALAWGTHVNTYERSWEIVRRADHPALGLCLDSFHILSRGSDPAAIRDIPADRLFFLQLADAPHLDMDVLQWSRHHRLFPGQGALDLPAFLGHVLAAGYTGPLSLEVFNDVFRQSDPRRTAVDALRSLLALQEAAAPVAPPAVRDRLAAAAPPPEPLVSGYAFAELAVDDASGPAVAAHADRARFRARGPAPHQARPALAPRWGHRPAQRGRGRRRRGDRPRDRDRRPAAVVRRAGALLAPALPHPHGPAEVDLAGVAAPDGTEVLFCRTGADDTTSWVGDFTPTGPDRPATGGSSPSTTWR